jgi:hypothetical protein
MSMPIAVRALAIIVLALGMISGPAVAQDKGAVRVTSDVQYEYLDRWDVERLNQILTVDTPKFADIPVTYSAARNAVKLYRVT